MRQWRPSLAFVLGGALAATLAMSFAGLVVLRYLGPVIGFRFAALILGTVIATATALLGALLVRLLLRPIRALETYARSEGAAKAPAHFGTRELHATAQRVMAMAQALRDREATIRAFTDHVTHELKTPVAGIRAAAELMLDGGALTKEDAKLLAEIDGARAQIEQQLAALRRAAHARETRYLGTAALPEILTRLDPPAGLILKLSDDGSRLPMSPQGLAVVLGHLLTNAADHGATEATLTLHDRGLTVRDNGPGISAGNAARVFDPFFTTRRSTGGTGMGLAVVRNILTAHRGEITLLPADQGAVFALRFPEREGA